MRVELKQRLCFDTGEHRCIEISATAPEYGLTIVSHVNPDVEYESDWDIEKMLQYQVQQQILRRGSRL